MKNRVPGRPPRRVLTLGLVCALTTLFSERVYEEHFKRWNVRKYMKRSRKEEILSSLLCAAQTDSLPADLDVKNEDLQKAFNFLRDLIQMKTSLREIALAKSNMDYSHTCNSSKPKKESCQGPQRDAYASREQAVSHDPPTSSSSCNVKTPATGHRNSPSDTDRLEGQCDGFQLVPPSATNERASELVTPMNHIPALSSPQSLNLENILRNVYLSCSLSELDEQNLQQVPMQEQQAFDGSQVQLWNHLKQGIYLLKISSLERAFPTLHKVIELAQGVFVQDPLTFVQELFCTLSPVNTSLCPGLRAALLRGFCDLARQRLGSAHPVTVLCYELQYDDNSTEVSERGLLFMTDLLISMQGASSALTVGAETCLIEQLRRGKDYETAATRARRLLSRNESMFGAYSLLARIAAQQLEHVLMDQGDWEQALKVCFQIVGHTPSTLDSSKLQYCDECAVYTMEDIAKIYDHLGDGNACIIWLTQAAYSALNLWGFYIATTHIVDKLINALTDAGRHEDATFWENNPALEKFL